MERVINERKVFLIGFLLSAILHGAILSALIYLGRPEEKKTQKEKVVYINILKPQKKENKAPKVKKKIPSGQKKQVKPKRTKPKKKVISKKTPSKLKKKPQKKTKPKPVKEVAKTEKIKKTSQKKIVPPQVSQEELQEVKEEIQNLNIDESTLEADNFSISGLKGKELIYQHGSEEEKEEKVSDEDILAYIRELERYLNELARKKDLYPPMAKRLRIEGSLVVRFTIKADGSVDESSIKIIDSSNYNILDKGAVKLIKKYVPLFAKKYGKKPPKGDLTIELPITFEIIGW
ncbi:TonB family protein [Persephonella atlantica]|uniref:TonB family protein n=1 Tax=Persephonella atlantica TaxID=2699429 RepID=A0ABS1GH41_9AQUI|nr:energy transducer TonB [Persephonella atlantica]MBK3332067.1 TonB family protein [Persephonella atlantica]